VKQQKRTADPGFLGETAKKDGRSWILCRAGVVTAVVFECLCTTLNKTSQRHTPHLVPEGKDLKRYIIIIQRKIPDAGNLPLFFMIIKEVYVYNIIMQQTKKN
jgi:hypothetical protein